MLHFLLNGDYLMSIIEYRYIFRLYCKSFGFLESLYHFYAYQKHILSFHIPGELKIYRLQTHKGNKVESYFCGFSLLVTKSESNLDRCAYHANES